MTEQRAEYGMGSCEIRCAGCNQLIGSVVDYQGLQLLLIGSLLHKSAVGFCDVCGKQFYWHASDRILEAIINRLKNGNG